jgi:hypothetical protein
MHKSFIIFKDLLWYQLTKILVTCHNEKLIRADQSFRQGWQEVMQGKTHPLSELWTNIDTE